MVQLAFKVGIKWPIFPIVTYSISTWNVGWDLILSTGNRLDACGLLLLWSHVSDRLSHPHDIIREEMLQEGGHMNLKKTKKLINTTIFHLKKSILISWGLSSYQKASAGAAPRKSETWTYLDGLLGSLHTAASQTCRGAECPTWHWSTHGFQQPPHSQQIPWVKIKCVLVSLQNLSLHPAVFEFLWTGWIQLTMICTTN